MSFQAHYITLFIYVVFGMSSVLLTSNLHADAQTEALIKRLQMTTPQYQVDQTPYHPKSIQKQYSVTWKRPPIYHISAQEALLLKPDVEIEMTISAGTGEVIQAKVRQSSGSKAIDQRILDALNHAKLESIPGVDKNLTYGLVHRFQIKNPL